MEQQANWYLIRYEVTNYSCNGDIDTHSEFQVAHIPEETIRRLADMGCKNRTWRRNCSRNCSGCDLPVMQVCFVGEVILILVSEGKATEFVSKSPEALVSPGYYILKRR